MFICFLIKYYFWIPKNVHLSFTREVCNISSDFGYQITPFSGEQFSIQQSKGAYRKHVNTLFLKRNKAENHENERGKEQTGL